MECDVKHEASRPLIVTPWWPPRGGQFVAAEARVLDARVVAPPVLRGVPVVVGQAVFVALALPLTWWHRPPVVHGYVGAFGGLVAVLAKRLTGCRAVVHEMAGPDPNRFWRWRWLARWVHRNADAVRVPSEAVRERVEAWGSRAVVVPCISWEEGVAQPRFLFAAPLTADKGANVLAQAEAIAWRAGASFRLVRLEAVTHDTLLRWLDWADVLLCPSRGESFGVTAHEAAARGCAVVATRVGALGDLIDAGLAHEVPIGDADALARFLVEPPAPPEPEAVWALRGRCSDRTVGHAIKMLATERC